MWKGGSTILKKRYQQISWQEDIKSHALIKILLQFIIQTISSTILDGRNWWMRKQSLIHTEKRSDIAAKLHCIFLIFLEDCIKLSTFKNDQKYTKMFIVQGLYMDSSYRTICSKIFKETLASVLLWSPTSVVKATRFNFLCGNVFQYSQFFV